MALPENERLPGDKAENADIELMERGSASSAEHRKSAGRSSISSSTVVPAGEKDKGSRSNALAESEDPDALFAHLPEHEKEILKKQLDSPDVNVSFFALFRYASRMDILIMLVSALCAIVAGAALPLFTVSGLAGCHWLALQLTWAFLDSLRLTGFGIQRNRSVRTLVPRLLSPVNEECSLLCVSWNCRVCYRLYLHRRVHLHRGTHYSENPRTLSGVYLETKHGLLR